MTINVASGSSIRTITSIVYAASITPALPSTGDALYEIGTLTGNITVNNPSGTPTDGQMIRFRFTQDATGSRSVSFGAAYGFGTDVPATAVPYLASSNWEMAFSYSAGTSAWRCLAIVRGF